MSELPKEEEEISKWCHDAFELKVVHNYPFDLR